MTQKNEGMTKQYKPPWVLCDARTDCHQQSHREPPTCATG